MKLIKVIIYSTSIFRDQKELMKSLETPEEKRVRRLEKKVLIVFVID